MSGVYTLILSLEKDEVIVVGKLGELAFKKGFYVYVGSAMSGFKRIDRHYRVSTGENPTRRWHIDYLLPHTEIVADYRTKTGKKVECTLASSIGDGTDGIDRFGASDCRCRTHLFFANDLEMLTERVKHAHMEILK